MGLPSPYFDLVCSVQRLWFFSLILSLTLSLCYTDREITDEPGRYVAHSNLGLAYSFLEMFEESVRHYQYALQYAVQLNHLEAESMALMNLAITSRKIVRSSDLILYFSLTVFLFITLFCPC